MTLDWSIDLGEQVARHRDGLVVRIAGGEVMDIVQFPKGLATRELPRLLQEAVQAYRMVERQPKKEATPAPRKGPRNPTLSLKKGRREG